MESLRTTVESSQRLAGQLQALSEIAESLTYRLLTVEERLAGLDRQVQQLQSPVSAAEIDQADDAALRLDETEERLTRLELLLGGVDAMASPLDGRHSDEQTPEDNPLAEEFLAAEPMLDWDERLAADPTVGELPEVDGPLFAEEPLFQDEPLDQEEPQFLDEQDQPDAEDGLEHQQAA